MSRSLSLLCVALAALLWVPVASAEIFVYQASLSGPNESPANTSPGTGSALVTFDLDAATMHVQADFTGLEGTVTNAHIHCCTAEPGLLTAGVATTTPTFPGFPSGVTEGTYDQTLDLTDAGTYNAAFVTGNGGTLESALDVLLQGIADGKAYFNIHSSVYGGGEIRGFLTLVPEPAAGSLLLTGLLAAGIVRRRRRRDFTS